MQIMNDQSNPHTQVEQSSLKSQPMSRKLENHDAPTKPQQAFRPDMVPSKNCGRKGPERNAANNQAKINGEINCNTNVDFLKNVQC